MIYFEDMAKRHIFLTGFMGSGKTYWGLRLAQHLSMPFIDLDAYIEQEEQMAIGHYFETQGEAIFREVERFHLHGLASRPPSVIAVGGGTPCFFDNIDWMNQHGNTAYLRTQPIVLARRLRSESEHRPLIKGLSDQELYERIFTMLLWREPFYNKATCQIDMPATGGEVDVLFKNLYSQVIPIAAHEKH